MSTGATHPLSAAPDPGGQATPAAPSRRSRWGRVVAAVSLAAVAAYLACEGPFRYSVRRGWIPYPYQALFRPARLARGVPLLAPARESYLNWWRELAERHTPSGVRVGTTLEDDGRRVQFETDQGIKVYSDRRRWEHDWVMLGARKVVVEDRSVTRDGKEVLSFPADVKRIQITYVGGVLTVDADGKSARVRD